MKKIPPCLSNLYEVSQALFDADKMLKAMKAASGKSDLSSGIQFLEGRIQELADQQARLSGEAERFLEPIRAKNNRDYLCIKLHFFLCCSWPEVAEYLGIDRDDPAKTASMSAYRAIETAKEYHKEIGTREDPSNAERDVNQNG